MPACAVSGCTNRSTRKSKRQLDEEASTKTVTFHRFPKNIILKKKWVNAVGRRNWQPNKYSTICSVHFEEKYFEDRTLLRILLRENAIPAIAHTLPLSFRKSDEEYKFQQSSTSFASTGEKVSQINEIEISHQEIKVESNTIFTETLPVINTKQDENNKEELCLPKSTKEFIIPLKNISSQQIGYLDKQTNNVLVLANVNSIVSHKGCSVFMVTAKNDSQTTNEELSSNELSTLSTKVHIKTEIPEETMFHSNITNFSEESMVPVTQDEILTSPANISPSILKNILTATSNNKILDINNSEPDQIMIENRNNIATEECTSVDEHESESENFTVLRNNLERERREHRNKVKALQKTIQRLKKANEKLKETVKELKSENNLYG